MSYLDGVVAAMMPETVDKVVRVVVYGVDEQPPSDRPPLGVKVINMVGGTSFAGPRESADVADHPPSDEQPNDGLARAIALEELAVQAQRPWLLDDWLEFWKLRERRGQVGLSDYDIFN